MKGRELHPRPSRRELLRRGSLGFGGLCLAALLAERGRAEETTGRAPAGARHHRPRARRVVFLYLDGGLSQVDSFDPKPRLRAEHGRPFPLPTAATQFDDNGQVLGSPFEFRRYGECGLEVSDLFPAIGAQADRLCLVRSMTSPFSEHTNANYFLHTGLGSAGRPSVGAWVTYGLGRESDELPGFVVLDGGLVPPGGAECFGAGFLSAAHQGSLFQVAAGGVANVRPSEPSAELQARKLGLLEALDRRHSAALGHPDALEAAIANYELACAMQTAVPELLDLRGESAEVRTLYGMDSDYGPTRSYGEQCLVARRLLERGVRFVELTCPHIRGNDRWDQHSNLEQGHRTNALAVDRPIAGLLIDLSRRGLLEDTLLVFASEFGRTPFAQGQNGRDHDPFGFSLWLAGAGVRGGTVYGATDDYGYRAVDRPVDLHDLHATLLHLLGIDHTRLTVPFGGREMRLTDVHGRVIHDWLT
jgi:hypothetical protein